MLDWLFQNIATILICILLIGIVAAILIHMIRQKKQGKSSCGCGCSQCLCSHCAAGHCSSDSRKQSFLLSGDMQPDSPATGNAESPSLR